MAGSACNISPMEEVLMIKTRIAGPVVNVITLLPESTLACTDDALRGMFFESKGYNRYPFGGSEPA